MKRKLLVIVLVSLVLGMGATAKGVTEEWVKRYDGGVGVDSAKAIALDSSGNVCVTGEETQGGTISGQCRTISYDAAGNQLWSTAYDGPVLNANDGALAIATDSSGNVYITGYSPSANTGQDIPIVKYNSSGVQQWAARYDYNSQDEQGWDIVVDGSGNVYVVGMTGTTGVLCGSVWGPLRARPLFLPDPPANETIRNRRGPCYPRYDCLKNPTVDWRIFARRASPVRAWSADWMSARLAWQNSQPSFSRWK